MSKKTKRLLNSYGGFDDDFMDKSSKIMAELDPDLQEYFNDMRLSKPKKSKEKSKKARFSIGDQVAVQDTFGTIIYGPYKSDSNKDTYEIETEDNRLITAEDDGSNISLYVPPIEEVEDDDLI